KTLSDLFDAHLLDFAHNEDGAERGGELVDTTLQDSAGFRPYHARGGRLGLLIGHLGLRALGIACERVVKRNDRRSAAGLSDLHQSLIDHDACQPRAEFRAASKIPDMTVRLQVGI